MQTNKAKGGSKRGLTRIQIKKAPCESEKKCHGLGKVKTSIAKQGAETNAPAAKGKTLLRRFLHPPMKNMELDVRAKGASTTKPLFQSPGLAVRGETSGTAADSGGRKKTAPFFTVWFLKTLTMKGKRRGKTTRMPVGKQNYELWGERKKKKNQKKKKKEHPNPR